MKILCVRQPWAWAIIYARKNIENRSWATTYRGSLLIAAGAGNITAKRLKRIEAYLKEKRVKPDWEVMQYGGIAGIVELVDCVKSGDHFQRSTGRNGGHQISMVSGPCRLGAQEFPGRCHSCQSRAHSACSILHRM
jgi:hypothetical protein